MTQNMGGGMQGRRPRETAPPLRLLLAPSLKNLDLKKINNVLLTPPFGSLGGKGGVKQRPNPQMEGGQKEVFWR